MTAEDVAFSLNRNRNLQPDLGGFFAPFWRNVGSVAATGASEVTITLERADVLFWKTLSMASGAVSKKAYVERQGKAYGTPKGGLICTGPSSWTAGRRASRWCSPGPTATGTPGCGPRRAGWSCGPSPTRRR